MMSAEIRINGTPVQIFYFRNVSASHSAPPGMDAYKVVVTGLNPDERAMAKEGIVYHNRNRGAAMLLAEAIEQLKLGLS